MSRLFFRRHAFTIMEVMVSIAILSLLVSALMTFGFGLADRRDRLVREGDRSATLARVMDRIERLVSTAVDQPRVGTETLQIVGRGVWPQSGRAGVPAGPVRCTGRLSFDADAMELSWQETSDTGEEFELLVSDVQAIYIDRFEELVTTSGAQPPIRLSLWLAPVGDEAQLVVDNLEDDPFAIDEFEPLDPSAMMPPPPGEDELPPRPADVVFVLAEPLSRPSRPSTSGGSDSQPGGFGEPRSAPGDRP